MSPERPKLSDVELDILKEVGNIGAGNAATALSQMVGRPVHMSLTKAQVLPVDHISDLLGGSEQVAAAVHMPIYGDLNGVVLLFFPLESLPQLTQMLTGQNETAEGGLSEMGRSAVKELGSILTGAYSNAIFKLFKVQIIHGLPTLVLDMAQAVLESAMTEMEQAEDNSLFIETQFTEEDKQLTGSFFLVPEMGSLDILFKAASKTLGLP